MGEANRLTQTPAAVAAVGVAGVGVAGVGVAGAGAGVVCTSTAVLMLRDGSKC